MTGGNNAAEDRVIAVSDAAIDAAGAQQFQEMLKAP